jgi:uncharacterized protein YegL
MARKGLTEIVMVIDRSGSMASIKDDAIGGLNTFIEAQQKVKGEANLTAVLFDDEYILYHDAVDIKKVELFNEETYVPRSMTALLDAIGKTANDVGERLRKTNEKDRPEKVLFVILTDGFENASREFTKPQIVEMIDHQREKYNWEFAFLAANQDAIQEGGGYGISKGSCLTFTHNAAGTEHMAASLACYATNYRMGIVPVWSNTDDDKGDK